MKLSTRLTTTYEMGNDVMVDIVTTEDTYEAWLYTKNIGIKEFMIGLPKENTSFHKMTHYVKNHYIEYLEDYMEEYV